MGDSTRYEPEDDDILVHRLDGRDVYFSTYVGYGVGEPHFFIALDENGDDECRGAWWLDAEQAEHFGRTLLGFAARCRQQNEEERRRRMELKRDRPSPP